MAETANRLDVRPKLARARALHSHGRVPLVAHPLVEKVIGCAVQVHRTLGPGLLESAYSRCLEAEFRAAGIPFRSEVPVPLKYRDVAIDSAYRIDILIGDVIVVEVKCVARLLPVHSAQVLTYMRLVKAKHGLLFNFNAVRLTDSMRSFLLDIPEDSTRD
jgi:GxxExxY protein